MDLPMGLHFSEKEVSMLIARANTDTLVVNSLPDGSRVIIDSENERVFAMNATAGAAWDACTAPTTLSAVTQNMQRSFHEKVNEELAEDAIQQLERQQLVRTSGAPSQATRRKFIHTLGAIAVPLVVSLSVTEQRAYAKNAKSGKDGGGGGKDGGGDDGGGGHGGDDRGHHDD
jgi:uncharacterized membrane protein YgcG